MNHIETIHIENNTRYTVVRYGGGFAIAKQVDGQNAELITQVYSSRYLMEMYSERYITLTARAQYGSSCQY